MCDKVTSLTHRPNLYRSLWVTSLDRLTHQYTKVVFRVQIWVYCIYLLKHNFSFTLIERALHDHVIGALICCIIAEYVTPRAKRGSSKPAIVALKETSMAQTLNHFFTFSQVSLISIGHGLPHRIGHVIQRAKF